MACTSQASTEKSDNTNLILATTTSTQDSGLLDLLIPLFQEQSGYNGCWLWQGAHAHHAQ